MKCSEVFEQYRLQERRCQQIGMTDAHEEKLWRYDVISQGIRFIADHCFSPEELSIAVHGQRDQANKSQVSLEWKWYSADSHSELLQRILIEFGFVPDDEEALLAMDIAEINWPQPILRVRRCETEADLEQVFTVQQAVWQSSMAQRLTDALKIFRETPELMSYYLVEIDGTAVCSGWSSFTPGSDFVGLWAGGCLPQYRSRGCYRALVWARAQEAITRGRKYLTIDALPSSRPIVERLGFELLSMTTPFEFDGKTV